MCPTVNSVYILSHFSCVQLFVTLWILAHQTPMSMEFSRENTGLSCHFPSPENLPASGIKPMSFKSPALARGFFFLSFFLSFFFFYH